MLNEWLKEMIHRWLTLLHIINVGKILGGLYHHSTGPKPFQGPNFFVACNTWVWCMEPGSKPAVGLQLVTIYSKPIGGL
jgi:hypothetical protein